jgi:diacylglycerol O-acyltransferase
MTKRTDEPLSHVDAAWLRMDSPTNAMVINAALTFEGAVPYAEFERLIEQRLLRHPRFRERVIDPGIPLKNPITVRPSGLRDAAE